MQTVVETPLYLKSAVSLFSIEEREAIVNMVASDPECGDLIPGTGGFRKVRVGRGGRGKRGGGRVIYIPVFLIAAYAKNEKVNLTRAERNELAKLANTIFTRNRSES